MLFNSFAELNTKTALQCVYPVMHAVIRAKLGFHQQLSVSTGSS